jgi:hypothetical protein
MPFVWGTVRIIADITDPDIIQKVLVYLEAQPLPNQPVSQGIKTITVFDHQKDHHVTVS